MYMYMYMYNVHVASDWAVGDDADACGPSEGESTTMTCIIFMQLAYLSLASS